MFIIKKIFVVCFVLWLSLTSASELFWDMLPPGVDSRMDLLDSEFCKAIRSDRDTVINTKPDLINNKPVERENSIVCFTPDENLYFAASLQAVAILGKHAAWYDELSRDSRKRVAEACVTMGYKKDKGSVSYDRCVNSRYKDMMSPYEDKYRRETDNYIRQRKAMAENLVNRCDAALSVKRKRLPKDLQFPIAYFDKKVSSIPSWYLDKKLMDDKWLTNIDKLKSDELMTHVLGEDCPGGMIFWVTYRAPDA